jgi:hypothetical protein
MRTWSQPGRFTGDAAQGLVNIAALAHTQEELDADRQWARDYWSALVPHASGVGSYVNFMSNTRKIAYAPPTGPGSTTA